MEIIVCNVNKVLQEKQILSEVSFRIKNGECMGLVGPNGAGKTTLIRSMLGLYSIDGEITFGGNNVKDIDFCRNDIFFMLDNFGLFKELTVRENLEFFYRTYAKSKINTKNMNDKIDEILQNIDLIERSDDSVKILSKGMKQRLSLGRTMVFHPEVMLLDEPFASLDVEGQFFLIDYINELKSRGTTIMISSHDLGHLQKICDSVLFIKKGKTLKKMHLSESGNVESAYRSLVIGKGNDS